MTLEEIIREFEEGVDAIYAQFDDDIKRAYQHMERARDDAYLRRDQALAMLDSQT